MQDLQITSCLVQNCLPTACCRQFYSDINEEVEEKSIELFCQLRKERISVDIER